MKNKLLCTVLAIVLAAGVAGCNSAENVKSDGGKSVGENSVVTSAADSVTDSEEGSTATDKSELKGEVKSEDTYSFEGEINAVEGIRAGDVTAAADSAKPRNTIKAPTLPEKAAEKPAVVAEAPKMTEEEIPEVVDLPEEPLPIIEEPEIPEPPQAGQLTAGEWNDNENWGFFKNLVDTGKIEFPSYGIDPRHRIKVDVKNDKGEAVINANVRLIDVKDQSILWSAVTDKDGIAYLFADGKAGAVTIEAESGGVKNNSESIIIDSEDSGVQGNKKSDNFEVSVKLSDSGKKYKKTDVMFILDTTGSMDDEMLFLQSEFTAIAKETGTEDVRYSVNFYRDKGDDYVTKCNEFTDDISKLQKLLNSESADGGGDLPEAVAQILDETMNKVNWDDESVKLAFLIFDAPPHDGTEETVVKAIKKAAEKGIHIIPVVSSNSDRNTELFGRAVAIATGSTYVFLTDDSGIGGSHLEPIIGDYEVEKLYDIIVRIIKDYQQK